MAETLYLLLLNEFVSGWYKVDSNTEEFKWQKWAI